MRGFSVAEIVIGAAIVAVAVTAVSSAWVFYSKLSGESTRTNQGALLLEEGNEALQYMRDKGWTANIANLSLNTTYYLVWNGSDYEATTTATLINSSYTRTISFTPVRRDSSDNIVSSGGTIDTGTRLATINIYPQNATTGPAILQGQTLVHNIFSN